MVVRVEEKTIHINSKKMCSGGAVYMYEDEDHYEKEQAKEKFYNKVDDKWDYYSGLPNPKAYESD